MQEVKLMVPTYLANLPDDNIAMPKTPAFDQPDVAVLIAADDFETRGDSGVGEHRGSLPSHEAASVGPEKGENPDFGEPNIPVLIHEADGVRIVLGAHDYEDYTKPDVQIERRPNGWVIFLHPWGGSDPSGYVYFLDNGRSFLVRDNWCTGVIKVLKRVLTFPRSIACDGDDRSSRPWSVP